jgi:hypothetical protein
MARVSLTFELINAGNSPAHKVMAYSVGRLAPIDSEERERAL